jgi:hypothetical protein
LINQYLRFIVTSAIFLACHSFVHADAVRLDINASLPDAPAAVIGSITWESGASIFEISQITSVDLSINGFKYSTPQVGWINNTWTATFPISLLVGSIDQSLVAPGNNGVGYTDYGVDSFWLEILDPAAHGSGTYGGYLSYGSSSPSGLWEGDASFTIAATATDVPEPKSYAIVITGLGILGVVARRRK